MPNEVIQHLEVKCIKGKGMCFYKDNMSYGNLYIKFLLIMPKRGELNSDKIDQLKNVRILHFL